MIIHKRISRGGIAAIYISAKTPMPTIEENLTRKPKIRLNPSASIAII
jgi:hypothetical protein